MNKITMQQRVLTSGFILQTNKVLLLRRNEKGFLAGCWEMPGGKVEFGEDPLCGVLREVKEEAGIDCEIVCPYFTWHTVNEYKGVQTHFVEIDFVLNLKPNQKVKPGEGMDDFSWASKEEIDEFKMTPEMKKAIVEGFKWTTINKP